MTKHYFITNREIVGSRRDGYVKAGIGEYIRNDGIEAALKTFRVGTYNIDSAELILFKPEDYWFNKNNYTAAKKDDIETLGSERMLKELAIKEGTHYNGGDDILIFIHGDRTNFEEALQMISKLHEKYVTPIDSPIKHIIMFSWPSKENILAFKKDDKDAVDSGAVLSRFILKLVGYLNQNTKESRCKKLHLMTHSKGGIVLESMIANLSTAFGEKLPLLFQELILLAAYVDYDIFEKSNTFHNLKELCKRIHIYYHRKDLALRTSTLFFNPKNHLGLHGIKNESLTSISRQIFEYDISETSDDESTEFHYCINHWYHYTNSSVVEDIKEVLEGQYSRFIRLNQINNYSA